jgi:hypothetical protein
LLLAFYSLLARAIESETGTSSSTYSLQIAPTFIVDAITTVGPIHQVFTPTLTVNFQGSTIAVGDLEQTQTGSITQNQTTTRQDIINERYISYVLVAVSLAGLGVSTYSYTKSKPAVQKSQLEKIMAAHKGLIIETQGPSTLPKEAIRINVKNIEELTKTAEILGKPIILTRPTSTPSLTPTLTTTLTIIDHNTIYQYSVQF